MNNKIPSNITSIIFDLGGVLFDIDYRFTQQAFMKLGATTSFDMVYSQQQQAGIFDEFEKGNISPEQFRQGLRQWLPTEITDQQIDNAWNALLIGLPSDKVQLLTRLGKKYDLFLLSNTNQIHLPEVMNMIRNSVSGVENSNGKLNMDNIGSKATNFNNPTSITNFQFPHSFFLKEYYSCQMNMRKPDKMIYETVCFENNLNPETTLFVDDSIQNIEGAQVAGLQTLHATPYINLHEYFS